jgi:hypothetical protein
MTQDDKARLEQIRRDWRFALDQVVGARAPTVADDDRLFLLRLLDEAGVIARTQPSRPAATRSRADRRVK